MTPLIRIDGLSVRYGPMEALNNVTLDLEPGQVVALIGPNGAGKTTLCRALMGELPLAGGRIRLHDPVQHCDLDPHHPNDRRLLWSVVRWVRDVPVLYEKLSVREFLEFTARAHGVPEDQVLRQAEGRAGSVGLGAEILGRRIGGLSLGTRHKIHVASGFLSGRSGPHIVILDEPMGNMDSAARILLCEFFRRYVNPEGRGSDRLILVSSNSLAELSNFADHVIMIDRGRASSGGMHDLATRLEADLHYQLSLFDDRGDELAQLLKTRFGLECRKHGRRTVEFTCDCEPALVAQILETLRTAPEPFRLRELRERYSPLDRIFAERTKESE